MNKEVSAKRKANSLTISDTIQRCQKYRTLPGLMCEKKEKLHCVILSGEKRFARETFFEVEGPLPINGCRVLMDYASAITSHVGTAALGSPVEQSRRWVPENCWILLRYAGRPGAAVPTWSVACRL
ncbi:MAG: hypothetical protein WBQ68_16885 [Terriglobales bacterium]